MITREQLKEIADGILYTDEAINDVDPVIGEARKSYNQGVMDLADKLSDKVQA